MVRPHTPTLSCFPSNRPVSCPTGLFPYSSPFLVLSSYSIKSNPLDPTGLKSFEVSLPDQTADVYTQDDAVSYETVLEKIKKTGKAVSRGERDGVEMGI